MSGAAPQADPVAPPLLLAAGVLFWGWQTGYVVAALAVALLVEAPRWTRLRLELAEADFNRVADFTTWLFVGVVAYLVATRGVSRGVITAFQWLPALLAPIVVAQRFSRAERINLTALLRLLRHLKKRGEPVRDPAVDLSWAFLAVAFVAAGAANQRGDGYYAGLLLLVAWALWSGRPAHARPAAWMALFAVAGALGYGGQLGLALAQAELEARIGDWLFDQSSPDPYRSSTAIGHVGELKRIGSIVARVHARPGDPDPPPLLHRASYNLYSTNLWIARSAPLAALDAEADGSTWVLSTGAVRARNSITARFESGRSLIALPAETARISGLAAVSAANNRLGSVQVELEGGWIRYTAERAQASLAHGEPTDDDRQVPEAERETLEALARQLGLHGLAPQEALARVRRHFAGFTYSLYRAAPAEPGRALVEFLARSRSGHCEYFAAASTLLLRAAGIPARYATGYAVLEYSRLEEAWLVRQRHAHAWSRAWVGDRWVDFDATPPQWFPAESGTAPAWETVADLLRWAGFRWSQRDTSGETDSSWLWIAAALAALLAWRLARLRTTRNATPAAARTRSDWPGRDSEFYALERHLGARGFPRQAEESAGSWAARITQALPSDQHAALYEAVRLHERYRFDPAGLDAAERSRLRELCAAVG